MSHADSDVLIRRQQALASGESARTFDRAVRSGLLVPVDRGVYVRASRLEGRSDWQAERDKYRLRCVAGATRRDRDALLTHHSAAAVHDLATLHPERKFIHVGTESLSGGGVKNRTTVFHPGRIPDDDIVQVGGIRVTTPARTAVDVALVSDFPRALAVFDAALRMRVDRADLANRLERPRAGVGIARFALQHASRAAENPGESWSRAQVIEAGLPIPDLQRVYRLRDSREARVDCDWDGILVGEFDGKIKYRKEMRAGMDPEEVVIAEKLREDMLRERGLDVMRWIWSELYPTAYGQSVFIQRLRRRLALRGLLR